MLEYFMMSRAYGAAADASADAASARATARSASHQVERLEHRLAALELAMEALVRYLVKSGKMTEEEFYRIAREVDLEDGVLDGRRDMNKLRKVCPKCSKPNPAERPRCMWCGESVVEVKPVRLNL